ncbi:MAG TPA: tRNA (adenine-N(6)-)-methyltransferase [Chryseobacterium sp.]|nr:tRNA (adenine-N(6)-)-methyltransferase [Chryseobacterium sp.]
MKPFHFQQFSVQQHSEVFRVGTDGVLLGALAQIEETAASVLEVGTGSGIITLMLAQRYPEATFAAIDINPLAARLAGNNFKASPWSNRLTANVADFKTFETKFTLDHIVCNPPYFEVNDSGKDLWARQQLLLTFSDLIQTSSKVLASSGKLSVIIPADSEKTFTDISKQHQFSKSRQVMISGRRGSPPKRVVLEYTKNTNVQLIEEELVLENNPREYSREYLELTKDFHIFKKK